MDTNHETKRKFINPWKLFIGAFIPNWLLVRPEVSQGAKLCYARLCQYAGRHGECFPKQNELAEDLGLKSARQVINYIKELERLQLIIAIKTRFQGRNVYKFLYHDWMGSLSPNVKSTSQLACEKDFTIDVKDISHPIYKRINGRESINNKTYLQKINDFFNTSDPEWIAQLKPAYPKFDIPTELNKMRAWLISNPENPKKNFKRFAVNWLSRAKITLPEKQTAQDRHYFGVTDVFLNEKLGRIATKDMIKKVMCSIPNDFWWKISDFLRKRYPGGDSNRIFAEAERELIAEARNNKEKMECLIAGTIK